MGLTNGTTYYFAITATNAGGTSANSNQLIATPAGVPTAPITVSAAAGNAQATVTFSCLLYTSRCV